MEYVSEAVVVIFPVVEIVGALSKIFPRVPEAVPVCKVIPPEFPPDAFPVNIDVEPVNVKAIPVEKVESPDIPPIAFPDLMLMVFESGAPGGVLIAPAVPVPKISAALIAREDKLLREVFAPLPVASIVTTLAKVVTEIPVPAAIVRAGPVSPLMEVTPEPPPPTTGEYLTYWDDIR